jgi:NAD(P)-dependent dehydrogenase (short-subunit alcohol dehydrogenase family)
MAFTSGSGHVPAREETVMELEGQVAMVVGAGRGIGGATARELCVVCAYRFARRVSTTAAAGWRTANWPVGIRATAWALSPMPMSSP